MNTALGTITYSPNTNYFGSDALVINVSDLGNVGTGNILTATKTVNLNVVSVPDAPVITSDGGTATATISVNENTKSVTTVQATDVDSTLTSLVYSIDGGADAAKFAIVSTSGVLEFKVAPDFEFPSDANLDNIYEVVVKVTDPTAQSDTQAISVKVLDVVDQLLVSLDGSGNLTITDNVGNANAITVKFVAPNIVLTDANQVFDTAPGGGSLANGGKTLSIPLSSVTGKLTINASAGDDTLTVDYSGGNPVPAGGIVFNGGDPTTGPGDKWN